MLDRYRKEFIDITNPITNNNEFLKTKKETHHGINRFDHLIRVSYFSYIITRFLKLKYKETARAGLLHDFFTNETKGESQINALKNHPTYALENAKKYYKLTEREEDIIKNHMFPVTKTPPKYIESWIVDIVDDVASIYERCKSSCIHSKAAINFLLILLINFIQR